MNESSQIGYPTLALFLYDWREDLDRTEDAIRHNRHRFWRKIDPTLDKDDARLDENDIARLEKFAAKEKPEASEVFLWEDTTDSTQSQIVQIGDTYALRMTSPGGDETGLDLGMTSLDRLPALQKEIVTQINHHPGARELQPQKYGTIGQTWLLWGQLPGNHPQSIYVTKECYAQLSPGRKWMANNIGQGRFFGANVYELWHPPTDWQNLDLENLHQLIFLFPPRQPIEAIQSKMNQLYPDLTHLFCYRHKIIRAYFDSRAIEKQLTADAREIKSLERQVLSSYKAKKLDKQEVEQIFIELLEIFSRYSQALSLFEYQAKLIELNLINYTKRLEKIARLDSESQLEFLHKFASTAVESYQLKLTAEHSRFKLGLTPIENTIATLRYLLEQQSDLAREKPEKIVPAIVAVGIGMAASNAVLIATALLSTFGGGGSFLGLSLSLPIGLAIGVLTWQFFKK
ncbi:hypothetical protein IQ235_16505 [Oscillatoriales cyanobacterium LEGE 11467]|uniref:Uncharacterized protein n=1 Tax=Zarconia navalis LEGE 11467 TaxID=1828826 RepID=A0A928W1Q9_9CYAN|nr:hypothetical protein [Zarconia navalis]MBE9042376.1 hypothetical protein [Zarconia navalis LEGE 11467]